MGCSITVEMNRKQIVSISGNTCKHGEEYARNECIAPLRMVTSTVMTAKGIPLPVKTDRAIPKDKIFECMKIINGITVDIPVKTGDVILKQIFGSNIIATADMK